MEKKVYLLLGIIFGQGLMNILVINSTTASRVFGLTLWQISPIMIVLSLLFSISALLLCGEIVKLVKKEKDLESNCFLLERERELTGVLKAHRHDFINYLQVIYSMVQQQRYNDCIEYIKSLAEELKGGKQDLWVNKPVIDSLLFNRACLARQKGIDFIVESKGDLSSINCFAIDIARILSNLLDNAISAVEKAPINEKIVKVKIEVNKNKLSIEVNNKWPVISQAEHNIIFEKGYTTKGVEGNGLGLWIVKSLVDKHNGHISLFSNETTGTTFVVTFICSQVNDAA